MIYLHYVNRRVELAKRGIVLSKMYYYYYH